MLGPFIFGAELFSLANLGRRSPPLLFAVHGHLDATGVRGHLLRAYLRYAVPVTARRATLIAGLTPGYVEQIHPLARELIRNPQKGVVIPNGVDHQSFRPRDRATKADLRRRFSLPQDRPLAVFCASLDTTRRYKRLDLTLRALRDAQSSGVQLAVIGDGSDRSRYEQLADRLGVGDAVHFLGAQPRAAVADLMGASDVLVMSSDAVEAFPLVALEAFSCGLPAVLPTLPGLELFADEDPAFYFQVGDHTELARQLTHVAALGREERDRISEAARQMILDRFTWEQSVNALETALGTAVNRHRGRGLAGPSAEE
jgi:glycosyltransferase involved in cell wall biosynthesis